MVIEEDEEEEGGGPAEGNKGEEKMEKKEVKMEEEKDKEEEEGVEGEGKVDSVRNSSSPVSVEERESGGGGGEGGGGGGVAEGTSQVKLADIKPVKVRMECLHCTQDKLANTVSAYLPCTIPCPVGLGHDCHFQPGGVFHRNTIHNSLKEEIYIKPITTSQSTETQCPIRL